MKGVPRMPHVKGQIDQLITALAVNRNFHVGRLPEHCRELICTLGKVFFKASWKCHWRDSKS